jgi:hypothetical protein
LHRVLRCHFRTKDHKIYPKIQNFLPAFCNCSVTKRL